MCHRRFNHSVSCNNNVHTPILLSVLFFFFAYRFAFTAMNCGSGGGPYSTEVYLGLITVRVRGAAGDACLTGWVQRGWADTTAYVRAVPRHRPDHVAGYVQRPPVAFTPATSARDCDHHPLCSSLVDTMFLLVLHKDDQPEILPNSDHPVWEAARPSGSCAQRGAQTRRSVSGGPLRCPSCGRQAFHAAWAARLMVRDQKRHTLHARVPSEHPQHSARDHDAHLVHLQPGHSGHLHSGSERGLLISKHLRSHRGWWVWVLPVHLPSLPRGFSVALHLLLLSS